jgi:CTD kinase subunit beta
MPPTSATISLAHHISIPVAMAPAAEKPISEQPGPHPSYIQVAKPFIFQQKIEGQIIATGANPQREDAFRLNGVQWIDDTRRALQL